MRQGCVLGVCGVRAHGGAAGGALQGPGGGQPLGSGRQLPPQLTVGQRPLGGEGGRGGIGGGV